MDPDSGLLLALSVAGLLLLGLEIVFPGAALAPIGALALCGAVAFGVYRFGLDVGAVLLLGYTTAVSLGLLGVLAFFPKAPLSRRWLTRASHRAAREEAIRRAREEAREAADEASEPPQG